MMNYDIDEDEIQEIKPSKKSSKDDDDDFKTEEPF